MLSKSWLRQVAAVEVVPGKTMAWAAAPGPVMCKSILLVYAIQFGQKPFFRVFAALGAVKNREQ